MEYYHYKVLTQPDNNVSTSYSAQFFTIRAACQFAREVMRQNYKYAYVMANISHVCLATIREGNPPQISFPDLSKHIQNEVEFLHHRARRGEECLALDEGLKQEKWLLFALTYPVEIRFKQDLCRKFLG